MLLIFGLAFFLVISALILFMPALWAREIRHAYSSPRAVTCPETHQQVAVTIDARHVVATELRGAPGFRLSDCSRWPERARCAQGCLSEALRTVPFKRGEVEPLKTTQPIYHLPILIAAFTAWYVGMIWHSPYLFRTRWIAELGLTQAQFKQLVESYAPHLLSAGTCLLFAYGVAWVQTWLSRKGYWHGILSSTLLWAALALTTLPSMRNLPRDLLIIEGSYTLVATVLVGAIVGGLSGKLVLPVPEKNQLEA